MYKGSPHIASIDKDDIAKSVLMPGDPLRAKWIAETYLTDVKLVSSIRNIYAYTGYYNGKKVTVMASGMGMPSIGIYSWELYSFFGVENIIRVGSCGAYIKELDLYDIVLTTKAYSTSVYAKNLGVTGSKFLAASSSLNNKIIKTAKENDITIKQSVIHSSDNFYHLPDSKFSREDLVEKYGITCVEMESFALFANAKALGKKASCILTVSDNIVTHALTTAEERQSSFSKMIELALKTVC
jgi:purine-nucleoside phosphorylase